MPRDETVQTACGAIRQATGSDALQIEQLYLQLVSNPAVQVLPERLDTIAGDPATALFVFESDGAIIGTVLVSLCADAMFGHQPFAVVENIVVDSKARRQRIGERLLQAVETFCSAADCSKLMLLSSASRKEAHAFFERCRYSGSAKQGFIKYRSDFTAQA